MKAALIALRASIDHLVRLTATLMDTTGNEPLDEAASRLIEEIDSLTSEAINLEAVACRYLCLVPDEAPEVPKVTITPRPVVPADRLITLAGPGHLPTEATEDEAEAERLELKTAFFIHQKGE